MMDLDLQQIRKMVMQAKNAAEITHGDEHKEFLFELDEFQMREFLWLHRQIIITDIKSADSQLTAALHKELIATGLVSAAQWNAAIAPKLSALTAAIEPYKEVSQHWLQNHPVTRSTDRGGR